MTDAAWEIFFTSKRKKEIILRKNLFLKCKCMDGISAVAGLKYYLEIFRGRVDFQRTKMTDIH